MTNDNRRSIEQAYNFVRRLVDAEQAAKHRAEFHATKDRRVQEAVTDWWHARGGTRQV